MAYKFQIGTAKLSGSVQLTDGSLDSTDVNDATAANIVTQIDNGEIPIAKLAAKTISGKDLGQNLDALSVDDSSIEYSAGSAYNGSAASTIRVKASGVTNAMLAGSIANAKLTNSTISGVALGSNLNALSRASDSGLQMSDYNGSAAISNLKVDITELADGAIANGDFIAFADATDGNTKTEAVADLAALFAGDGLTASNSVMAVGVDDSSIEINSDALRVKASGVTNAMLAGSIANGKLANSSITVGGSGVALGGTITGANIAAALNSDLGGNFTIGNQSSDTATFSGGLTVTGDLTVNGTTTTIDTTNLTIEDSLITLATGDGGTTRASNSGAGFYISGSVIGNDVTLTCNADGGELKSSSGFDVATGKTYQVNGTDVLSVDGAVKVQSAVAGDGLAHSSGVLSVGVDDSSIEINSDSLRVKASGITNAMLAGSIADSKLNTISTAGKVALSALEIDGESNAVTSLDPADLFIVDDGAGGSNKKMAASVLKTFIGSGVSPVNAFGDADATLAVGINYANANTTTARTLTLPASGGLTAGESVKVKVAGVSSGAVTIARAGSQTIDGSLTSILLESDNAAVELVYVAVDDWRVF